MEDDPPATRDGPLSDLAVVEMTAHRAGPFCGALLADLGADVVKIERPDGGDPARDQGPGPAGRSGYFMANNRNKRSVALDLKAEAGREAALDLVADADVFVENFGYGVAEKLGLGYDALRERNPGIVYASVKGYGETGPLREKPGLDLILQAEGGIMSVTGPEGGEPVKVGQAVGDLSAGMFAAIGILARLHERERAGGRFSSGDVDGRQEVGDGRRDSDGDTGRREAHDRDGPTDDSFVGKLDVGLFDAIVSLMNEYLTFYSLTGDVPGPQGTSHQSLVPYQLFETADGHVVTGVPSDDRWDDFVEAVGREELARYRTNADRVEHAETVVGVIQDAFEGRSTEYWLDRLTEYGFPNGPLNDVQDVVEHEQSRARGLVREHADPDVGTVVLPGHPVHFPDVETTIDRPAPRLGEHTEEVFAEVAGAQTTLDEWRAGGAFGD